MLGWLELERTTKNKGIWVKKIDIVSLSRIIELAENCKPFTMSVVE